MSINATTVEEAGVEWFLLRQGYGGQVGELVYAIGHGAAFAWLRRAKPEMAPGEAAASATCKCCLQVQSEERNP